MTMLTWIVGLAVSVWTGAMAAGAILRTKSAKAWFGDMLEQSPTLMTINGIGLLISAVLILLNLFFPEQVSTIYVKFALVGIVIAQASSLFMLIRGDAPTSALAGPIVLLIFGAIYWFIRT